MTDVSKSDGAAAGRGPGRLRIVCLGEHALDPGLAKATKPAMKERFPSFQASIEYQDDPEASDENRPLLQGSKVSQAELQASVDDRLAAMDA